MKKLFFSKNFLVILLLGILFLSCKKSNNESSVVSVKGSISLEAHVVHHSWDVSGIMVYLKKNATDFPGSDSSKYDFKGQADGYGKITFDDLYPGNYYIYAAGYDAYWGSRVIGYTPVILDKAHTVNNQAQVTIYSSE